ncbi:GL19494 [Drosophila persimilis]|uniref:GL19494 n=1 Tax=Drosophila persimilis TaxID=7234 RepID=B4G9J1_DROPE|nr:uncharacterized protein LOC6589168 [Drosophila persimilis]EDW29021.1 GL19494 [Drosophila persimilis]
MFWPKHYPGCASLWLPLLLSLLYTQNASTFIVPQELPTILSLVFSNIPPIKKGTDSRLGFGFRLGEHADFQVLVELGPQKETKPIGEPSKDDQSFNKRQVSPTEQKALLRQQYRQQLKEEAERLMTSTERNGATWLESWSNGMKPQKPKAKGSTRRPIEESQAPNLPLQPQVQENAMQQLQQLYKMASTSSTSSTTAAPPPYAGGPLNLGGPSGFKLPPPALEQESNALSNIGPARSKSEITKELMDVSLETAEA